VSLDTLFQIQAESHILILPLFNQASQLRTSGRECESHRAVHKWPGYAAIVNKNLFLTELPSLFIIFF
jgi:hypothetical protein